MIKAGVVGWPIEQSKSPIIHNYWLDKYDINGSYIKISLNPERFTSGIKELIDEGYAGVNVTVPHKENALRISTFATDRAHKIGAANTLIFKDNKIYADNTDGTGFIDNLENSALEWRANVGPAMVLGAGGAARSIIYSLLAQGTPKIILANRTYERAEKLADIFGSKISVIDWNNISIHLPKINTLINTTVLGMVGSSNLDVDLNTLTSDTLVTDIVYNPLITPLILKARKRGCTTVDGLGMLLYQAVPGFKGWFGVEPTVDETLRKKVLAEL